jgi:type II secretory pathway pseudopilin PulG
MTFPPQTFWAEINNQPKHQRGSTLIVALIMLVLLTLVAVSAINSTSSSIQIVGNEQFRQEAGAVTQQAIENVISTNFTVAPASAPISVDINNDGKADYTGQVNAPTCTSSIPLTNGQLNPFSAIDSPCISSGQSTTTGIMGASGVVATAQSWCFKQSWDIKANVVDSNGTNTTVHQGVFIRVPTGTGCP